MAKYKVPDNKTIPQLEEQTIKFWVDNKVFEKSVEQRSKDNLYVFYDGPPFISGLPHYGHLLGSIAKDIIPRYWTMKGKRVERVWGWDAHGLTVENKVQSKLGIKGRRDIISYGLEKFIKECYVYTSETSAEWKWYIDKIGRWVDMENAYKTTDQTYMESVMWAFKKMYEKDLIYVGVYTSLYCTTCGTPVSNFEITMDNTYKEIEDPAITVQFPITSEGKFKGVKILAWTTTPWTIPSNRALVIKEDELYSIVEFGGEKFILAKPRLEAIFADKKYKVVQEVLGKELIGLAYEPPYRFFASRPEEFKVYAFEGMVTMDDGTGVVHSAPGFGEVDTAMGRHYGLTIMLTIDDEGKFVEGNNGENPFVKMFYTKANPLITEDLQKLDYLFSAEKILHRVPYHDRCNTVLIQRAQNSWFVSLEKLRTQALENNKDINWVPEHLKDGRFAIGIKQAPDWCISRTRFWATPMPVWISEDGDKIVVGSIKELEDLSGKKVTDLHRPFIDEITIEKEGKTYKRIPEVLDSWFEAGSMPFAQIHYPMENQEKFEKNFPGDYIVEYIAQTRAWFFFMHVLSTALFDKKSFKNVVSTGVLAGSDGRKMSKTYGNYTDPKEVLQSIGGDALRLYLMGSPLMVGENANFDDNELKTKLKNILNPLWNSTKFFLMYAEQFDWSPNNAVISKNPLDMWIVARLNQLVQQFAANMEAYLIPAAVNPIADFVDDLSRWYVRRSRDRISSGDNEALSTLHSVLLTFAKATAPAIPFVTEEIYQTLRDEKDAISVHLCDYPSYDEKLINSSLELVKDMESARELVALGHFARTQANIPVRQPLSTLEVVSAKKLSNELITIVLDELNIKSIKYVKTLESREGLVIQDTVGLDTTLNKDLEIEGNMREFTRTVQGLRKQEGFSIKESIIVTYPNEEKYKLVVEKYSEELKNKLSTNSIVVGDAFSVKRV